MANPEHLAQIKEGIEVWNDWRSENAQVRPDLSGADLSGTKLNTARLADADLTRADLTRADLTRADLSGALLKDGYLLGANLSGAVLGGAKLFNVRVGWTVFADNDLSETEGLEGLEHWGPSSIGIDTILRSGTLPISFLRGCGLPERFITYARSQGGQPIEFYSCFISYSSYDQSFAERLHADLQNKGARCWFAPKDLKTGEKVRSRISESIHVFDKLLLILSQHSIASQWVEYEVETALERERRENRLVLFPIRLDDAVMQTDVAWAAHLRQTRQIGDFAAWRDHDAHSRSFERLLRDLKADALAEAGQRRS